MQIKYRYTEGFKGLLKKVQKSIALTTYEQGAIILVGLNDNCEPSLSTFPFYRCMGMFATNDNIYITGGKELWSFSRGGVDNFYPHKCYVTGNMDIHDLVVDRQGRILFANTLYDCVATVDDYKPFKPVWKPPFIEELKPSDQCHLNGLALHSGRLKYVSVFSWGDRPLYWKNTLFEKSGLIFDVESNELVENGISMPHSPRVHRGKLYYLDSLLGTLNTKCLQEKGERKVLTYFPGYVRGLTFINSDTALVGVSKSRITGGGESLCGVMSVDVNTGLITGALILEDINEIYEVCIINNTRKPKLLGVNDDETLKRHEKFYCQ